jgi:hypothetical protein
MDDVPCSSRDIEGQPAKHCFSAPFFYLFSIYILLTLFNLYIFVPVKWIGYSILVTPFVINNGE